MKKVEKWQANFIINNVSNKYNAILKKNNDSKYMIVYIGESLAKIDFFADYIKIIFDGNSMHLYQSDLLLGSGDNICEKSFYEVNAKEGTLNISITLVEFNIFEEEMILRYIVDKDTNDENKIFFKRVKEWEN